MNVLAVLPLLTEILTGKFNFSTAYKIGKDGIYRGRIYFIADGICTRWPLFVKQIHHPANNEEDSYGKTKESIRKDIERYFGVLQAVFVILKVENKLWKEEEVVCISEVCVVLHNILIRYISKGMVEGEPGVHLLTELYEDDDSNEGNRRKFWAMNRLEIMMALPRSASCGNMCSTIELF